ncbi:MAG: eda [Naasia sp.]|nr:eda [Naasia sp.]
MSEVLEALAAVRAVPVLRSAGADSAVAAARGYAQGGMNVVELTFSTPGVLDAVRELAADADLMVGVGTVLTPAQARAAVAAGARFLVSPVWLPWLPDLARELGVAAVPGAATPSEIWHAHAAGVAAVKVFPIARLGGAAYIRDLLAPLPDLSLMATGGVTAATARELLDAGCLAVGVGGVGRGAPADAAAAFLAAIGGLPRP